MQLTPRYSGQPLIAIDGDPSDQLTPFIRQRRRLEASLGALDGSDWATESRCAGWSIKDVVAHLASVNEFWMLSISSGVSGEPTQWLASFDPAATPEQMVERTRALDAHQILEQFTDTNARLVTLLDGLDESQWSLLAEAPPGHLPIRLVVSHGLWDGWIHERDVWLPLGEEPEVVADEVAASLRYVVGLIGGFSVLTGTVQSHSLEVAATNPEVLFALELSETTAQVRSLSGPSGTPRLEGDATALLETLSFRGPFPRGVPTEWIDLSQRLAQVFDTTIRIEE
ncbi:MAG: maleylpyruvate isomerase family mycothiol-dependent enzyme [Actinomycetota bacterium]